MTSSRRSRARSERKAAVSHSNSLPLENILLQPLPPPLVVEAESMRVDLLEAQWVLGYYFRNPRLLEEALTHSSDPAHESYQRLEFVGDAVLSLAFTNYLYLNNPHLGRGELSALCSANVSNEKLARAELRHGLYRFVRRHAEELDYKVEEFNWEVLSEGHGEIDPMTNRGSSTKKAPKVLADIVESLAAAVYIDSGLDLEIVWKVEEFSRAVTTEGHIEIDRMSYEGNTKKAPRVLTDIIKSLAAAVYIDSGLNLEIVWKVFRSILAPIITTETMEVRPRTALHKKSQKRRKSTKFNLSVKRTKNIMKVFVDRDLISISSSKQKRIRDMLRQASSSDESDNVESGSSDRDCYWQCCGGECTSLTIDHKNCGECKNDCKEGSFCKYGSFLNPMFRESY